MYVYVVVACTRLPSGSAAVLWLYTHPLTSPQPVESSLYASVHATEFPTALTMYTCMGLYGCTWLWHALGSQEARLLFYSATRIYRPPRSLRDRCRMRQNTPLRFRKRSRCIPVCAYVCARGCGVHSVPERLGCCSIVLHASADLFPACRIVVVSVRVRR